MKAILRSLKWLFGILALAAIGLGILGTIRLSQTVELHPVTTLENTQASVLEGERLVRLYQCHDCHGENLAGTDFIDAGWWLLQLPAPNLTLNSTWTDASLESSIRHGVGQAGHPLLIMPSDTMNLISDLELASMTAYLRSLPPIDQALMSRHVGPAARVVMGIIGTNVMAARRIDHQQLHPESVGSTPLAMGQSRVQICKSCHGQDLAGQRLNFAEGIDSGNLTPDEDSGLGLWTLAEFRTALLDGRGPDGQMLSEIMPSESFNLFSEAEVNGLWQYLRSLPAVSRESDMSAE